MAKQRTYTIDEILNNNNLALNSERQRKVLNNTPIGQWALLSRGFDSKGNELRTSVERFSETEFGLVKLYKYE